MYSLRIEKTLDEIDRRLIGRLMTDGRATWADLAVDVGITAPAVAYRVRRLRQRGVIEGFGARVAADAVAPVSAFVTVRLEQPERRRHFEQTAVKLAEIQELHDVADAYLLKVRCATRAELQELVGSTIPQLAGACDTTTNMVMTTIKESSVLPVPE